MGDYKFEFEDDIFKDVFIKEDYYDKLVIFVSNLLNRDVLNVKVLDSSYVEEEDEKFSLHLFMDVDYSAIWLIFSFGDERNYLKEEYYYQTNDGIKLYDSPSVIRYNMKRICDEFNENDQAMILDYGFVLDIFEELLRTSEMKENG